MLNILAHIFISPINQSLFGIGLGMIFLTFTNIKPWIGKSLVWLSLTWVLLCSQFFFSYWLIKPLETAFPPIKAESNKWQSSSAIWVLACYHYDAYTLPLVSQFNHCSIERLVQAANMYRIKPTTIYLTGGNFNINTELNYAEQATKLLQELGVKKLDIRIINKGNSTVSEAKELKAQIKHQLLAVVSSATHGIRLAKILERSKINFVFVPVHYSTKGAISYRLNAPSTEALLRSERAFYEYGALVKYWLSDSNYLR
jgi:hypothetical protein